MTAPASQALRAWINGRRDLTDGQGGGPLSLGAFPVQIESPGDGSYATVQAVPTARTQVIAEDDRISTHRGSFMVYAGTIEAAENAAVALANAIRSLRGAPEPCGDAAGTTLLVHDNLTEPAEVPMPGVGGEQYAYNVSADFVMLSQ